MAGTTSTTSTATTETPVETPAEKAPRIRVRDLAFVATKIFDPKSDPTVVAVRDLSDDAIEKIEKELNGE